MSVQRQGLGTPLITCQVPEQCPECLPDQVTSMQFSRDEHFNQDVLVTGCQVPSNDAPPPAALLRGSTVPCLIIRFGLMITPPACLSVPQDGVLRSWDFSGGGSWMQEFVGHTAAVASLRFDGVKLVSAGKDGTVRFWDLRCVSGFSFTLLWLLLLVVLVLPVVLDNLCLLCTAELSCAAIIEHGRVGGDHNGGGGGVYCMDFW